MQLFTPARNSDLISGIANRRFPATYLTVGWGDRPFNYAFKENWKATPLSLDAAMSGGRR